MNKITYYTPVHKIKNDLFALLKSLENQTNKNFKWLILLNGEAKNKKEELLEEGFNKDWIEIYKTDTSSNIGFLKGLCCELATSEILAEVDYDDLLTKDATEKILKEFENPDTMFIYSNSAQFKFENNKIESPVYGSEYGWKIRPYFSEQLGVELNELLSFNPTPHYHARIEWAANHIRAFRKSAYLEIGGYNKSIEVGDDHDIVCRFYLQYGQKGFRKLDECIYLYQIHKDNTCNGSNRNKEIQEQVDRNYVNYAEKMYLKWANDNGLLALDLGGRFNCPDGYKSVDLLDADYIMDLEKTWELRDNSVGVLRAYHLIEHLEDPIHFFNEAYRVLAPGGFLLFEVPSMNCKDGGGAIADPTHKKFFNMHSFSYYTDEYYARFIRPQYKGAFQSRRLVEYMWENPNIPIISGQFIALKGWYNDNWAGSKLTDKKFIK